jgi:hypothetical protein
MKIASLILVLCIMAIGAGYDQLHTDLGVWMPSLSGLNDFMQNHSGWNTKYPTTGPLITVGYRHRWESFFALGGDAAYWTTGTSVTDQPVTDDQGGTWYLTGDTRLHEFWLTALPEFCFGNKDGFEFYIAPEISFVYVGITAKAEGAPSPEQAATVENQGIIEGTGLGVGIQFAGWWKLSESLGLGGTIRYITNDGKSDFDEPTYYPEPVSVGFKGFSIAPRLEINL